MQPNQVKTKLCYCRKEEVRLVFPKKVKRSRPSCLRLTIADQRLPNSLNLSFQVCCNRARNPFITNDRNLCSSIAAEDFH